MKTLFAFILTLSFCSAAMADGWTAPPPPMPAQDVINITDISKGWTDTWADRHYSLGGRPFIHGFLTEPAFACRSLRMDSWYSDSNEWGATMDVAYALTRRLSVRAEVPFAFDIGDEAGFGDSSLSLNGLFVENSRFLFAQSFEVGLPTGDDTRGLGTGDLSLATSSNVWFDPCFWQVTLQGNAGFSYVPDNGNWSFEWGATVVKSFGSSPFYALAEIRGTTPLEGDGDTEGLWLLGGGYQFSDRFGVRAGFTRTFDGDNGVVAGFSFNF